MQLRNNGFVQKNKNMKLASRIVISYISTPTQNQIRRASEWQWHLYPRDYDIMRHVFGDRIYRYHVMKYLLTNGYKSIDLLKTYTPRHNKLKYEKYAQHYLEASYYGKLRHFISPYYSSKYNMSKIFEDDYVSVWFVHLISDDPTLPNDNDKWFYVVRK